MEPRVARLRLVALLVAAVLAAAACGDAGGAPAATTVARDAPAATTVARDAPAATTVARDAPAATTVARDAPAATTVAAAEGCADVVGAEAMATDDGTYRFEVTLRSADTGWEKYADAWQVVGPGGSVLGTRELLHPHVDEQPFTRTLAGVAVPAGVDQVTVRARDSVAGWCGAEMTVAVPR